MLGFDFLPPQQGNEVTASEARRKSIRRKPAFHCCIPWREPKADSEYGTFSARNVYGL